MKFFKAEIMDTEMYVITFKVNLLYIKKYKNSPGIFQFSMKLYMPLTYESLIMLFIPPNRNSRIFVVKRFLKLCTLHLAPIIVKLWANCVTWPFLGFEGCHSSLYISHFEPSYITRNVRRSTNKEIFKSNSSIRTIGIKTYLHFLLKFGILLPKITTFSLGLELCCLIIYNTIF